MPATKVRHAEFLACYDMAYKPISYTSNYKHLSNYPFSSSLTFPFNYERYCYPRPKCNQWQGFSSNQYLNNQNQTPTVDKNRGRFLNERQIYQSHQSLSNTIYCEFKHPKILIITWMKWAEPSQFAVSRYHKFEETIISYSNNNNSGNYSYL